MSDDAWSLLLEFFSIFPWGQLPTSARGLDLGGTPGHAEAVSSGLPEGGRVQVHEGPLEQPPEGPFDFAYALEPLPKADDPQRVIQEVAARLKPGGLFLLYLPYALDNRPLWFRAVWQGSELLRKGVRLSPAPMQKLSSTAIAAGVYWPIAKSAAIMERAGVPEAIVDKVPLSPYRRQRFATMRAGAQERFAERAAPRFSRDALEAMMWRAELQTVEVSQSPPFWTALGRRRA